MLEVLVYLFENYYQDDARPDHDTLARKLTAAGFENEDIHDALDWLRDLTSPQEAAYAATLRPNSSSFPPSAEAFSHSLKARVCSRRHCAS
jgi:Smg protein